MKQRFIMLVGPAGSGKSTYAKYFVQTKNQEGEEIVILSSDGIREELYGDASIQRDPSKVFELMNQRTFEELEAGRSVIYDATNLIASRRKEMVEAVHRIAPDCLCVCILCIVTETECIQRQELRERNVPVWVIKRQFEQIECITYTEGWDRICTAYSTDNRTASRSHSARG